MGTYLFTSLLSQNTQVDNLWFTIKYIIVATLFIYLLWIFSKFLTKQSGIGLKDRHIKIHERLPLSNDKYLLLVELENIFYLLSSDKNGTHLIDKRDDITIISKEMNAVAPNAFVDAFKNAIKKSNQRPKE